LPVTTLGLDLFSGTYPNKLLFLWFPVIESNSIEGVQQVRWLFVWKWNRSQHPECCPSL